MFFYCTAACLERPPSSPIAQGKGSMTACRSCETQGRRRVGLHPHQLDFDHRWAIFFTSDLVQLRPTASHQCGHLGEPGPGGAAQTKASRRIAANTKLNWLSLNELAAFLPVSPPTRAKPAQQLGRGKRLRNWLKQPQFSPLDPGRAGGLWSLACRCPGPCIDEVSR